MRTTPQALLLMVLAILLLALNLRAPFTSVAPVLTQIMDALALGSASAGFLTALPLLTFALFSPLASKLARRVGIESSLVFALLLITLGIVLRSLGIVSTLYLGTVFIGIGIAIGNVLLPVVVKINFPARIAMITSLYIFIMGVGSTLSSSLMVPLSQFTFFELTGWQLALAINLLFPLLALCIWFPKIRKRNSNLNEKKITEKGFSLRDLLSSSVAWQVTLALGLNSFTFYSLAGWLPAILSDLGYTEINAGYIYGFLQFSTMLPGILLLPLLAKNHHHQLLIVVSASSAFIGLVGLLYLPAFAIFWVGLFGLGNCSTFIIALSFIGLRTSNATQAGALSGMSQGIGYALAATGPTLVGSIHAQFDSWTWAISLIAAVALLCTFFAGAAARDIKMSAPR